MKATTAVTSAAKTPVEAEPKSGQAFEQALSMLQKRIGSTLFEVSVRFSETSTETMQDKLLRLIEREVQSA